MVGATVVGHMHYYYITLLHSHNLSQPSLNLRLVDLAIIVCFDLEISEFFESKIVGFDYFPTLKVSRLASFTWKCDPNYFK